MKRAPHIQKNSSDAGFSMVEILISLVLIGMLISVMSVIVTNSSSLNERAKRRSDAGALAFQKVQDYINLEYNNIPIGDDVNVYEVEDFSAEAQSLNLTNAVAKVFVEPESVVSTVGGTTTTNFNQSITADSAFIAGSEIDAIDTDDAAGINRFDGRIRDSDFTNYTYNAWSPGPDNKPLPSIDLGSSQVVDTIRIEWWNAAYGADDFRIEAKDSNPDVNSGWTTIASGLSDNCGSCTSGDNSPQDIDVSSNTTPYRHWRMFVVDGTDDDWNVISEFEAFSSGTPGDIVEQRGSDASSNPGELFFSSSDLEMAENGSAGQQSVGIIFDDVEAPQGATITSASIEFTADENDSAAVTLLVSAVDSDNAQPWAGNFAVDNAVDNDNTDGLTGTAAKTTWTPGAWSSREVGADTTVDVTALVQEVVSRGGWSADNSMAFAIQYVSGSGKRVAERDPAPNLIINWSETTTVPGTYVDGDGDGDVDNTTLLRLTARITYDIFGTQQEVVYSTFAREIGVGE